MATKKTLIPFITMVTAWGMAFCLSCHLTAITKNICNTDSEPTFGGAILGESRLAFSRHFEKMSDLYFHRGVQQQHRQAFTNSLFQTMFADISPVQHVHTMGIDNKETMPWLWLSIKMDPHNIETYLVAAFWLSTAVNRPDIAHQVLQTGRINNPLDYQIDTEDGTVYLRENKYAEALKAFSNGLVLWPSGQDPQSEEAIIGKTHLLFYISLLHEINGNIPEAIKCMKEIKKYYPDDIDLQKRITALETGNKPSHLAEQLLHATLENSDRAVPCHRDDEHDHECSENDADHEHCDHRDKL